MARYVLEISKISGDQKPLICLTYVASLVVLPIPWLRSGRGSLPVQVSGGHKIQNPILHLYGATGFRGGYGPFCILFPSHACPGTASVCFIRGYSRFPTRQEIRFRASPQIGQGQGFKEDKLRKCSAEGYSYTPEEGKSRLKRSVLRRACCRYGGRIKVGFFVQGGKLRLIS